MVYFISVPMFVDIDLIILFAKFNEIVNDTNLWYLNSFWELFGDRLSLNFAMLFEAKGEILADFLWKFSHRASINRYWMKKRKFDGNIFEHINCSQWIWIE